MRVQIGMGLGVVMRPSLFRGQQATAWTPASLLNLLYLWDAANITQSDNTLVGNWPESKNGVAATQSTGNAQPTYRAGSAPFLSFAGAQFLVTAGIPAQAQPLTLLVCCRPTVATGDRRLFDALNSPRPILRFNALVPQHHGGTAFGGPVAAETLNAWTTLIGSLSGSSSSMRVRGVTTATAGVGSAGLASGSLRLGCSNAISLHWVGDIACIAVCTGAVSAADAASFEQWAAQKYGVTI